MTDLPETDDFSLAFPNIPHSRGDGLLSSFMTFIAFEAHGVRIGIEVSLVLALFEALNLFFPWHYIGVAAQWQAVWAWFAGCTMVLIFDQLVLCRAVYIFRRAYQLTLSGAYESALTLLETIAPEQKHLVRCPRPLFHMLRAEIFTQSETFYAAEIELELAQQAGAKGENVKIARSKLLRNKSEESGFSWAAAELKSARSSYGDSANLYLEEAILSLEEHKDLWEAKRVLKKVCEMPDELHSSGGLTSKIARAGLEAARLWTGEAEEGLEGLNIAIDQLRTAALYVDTLRPLLAMLHLERSLYLATHKEPELACFDLRLGLALCNYPRLRKKADKIQDELAWRYKVILPA